MTALASRSGLLDSEFIYAAESTNSGIVERVVSVVATGPRGDDSDTDDSLVQCLLVAAWAVSTLGVYLVSYSLATGLMS